MQADSLTQDGGRREDILKLEDGTGRVGAAAVIQQALWCVCVHLYVHPSAFIDVGGAHMYINVSDVYSL